MSNDLSSRDRSREKLCSLYDCICQRMRISKVSRRLNPEQLLFVCEIVLMIIVVVVQDLRPDQREIPLDLGCVDLLASQVYTPEPPRACSIVQYVLFVRNRTEYSPARKLLIAPLVRESDIIDLSRQECLLRLYTLRSLFELLDLIDEFALRS